MHLRRAAHHIAARLRAPNHQVHILLRQWLSTTAGWAHLSRPLPYLDDQCRLLTTLHLLHVEAFTLSDHQSSDTSPSPIPVGPVTPAIAAKGIGPAGSVPIPPHIWLTSAPGGLLLADARTPPQKSSNCPLVQAMLDALLASGLVAIHPGLPNAEAFVKRKSPTKAALIINMQALNSNCPLPPPKFRLPTLLQIGALLKACHTKGTPQHPCVAVLDLANCFWSIRLPPSNIGCIRIGTTRHTYTLLCLPFGWTHAPAIAQRLIHHHLSAPALCPRPGPPVHQVQYLDDISFLSSSPEALKTHVTTVQARLQDAGFLISTKSIPTPQPTATFIGKSLDLPAGTISALPAYYAGVVVQWLSLATGPYHSRKASRLLGRIVWLAQPHRRVHPFLAGPYAALRFGPPTLPITSTAFTRASLEALAMSFPSWRSPASNTVPPTTAPRYFADAAQSPWGTFFVGVWERAMGTRFFPCPPWAATQQSAELFGALKALSLAAHRGALAIHLYLDNHAAIHSLLRGKARSPLIPQNRLLRQLCHLLHWSSLSAAIHFVPSQLNPADPPSRWWSYPSPLSLVSHTWILGLTHLLDPPGAPWGTLHGLNRAL